MSTFNDEMSLKLAWQTAYELRTCPDEDTLYSENIDGNLLKHLSICHACREKRDMDPEERKAWKTLQAKFAGTAMQPATDIEKQAGQVWMLAKRCGGWRDDGRFINPPSVLLLDKIPPASWKVAQLYHDKRLMGNGDVTLNGRFGFAEAWNCYSLKEDRLDKCLGGVKSEELDLVAAASACCHETTPVGSFLSYFRMTETEVASFVVVSSVGELETAQQFMTVNQWLEDVFGSFSEVFNRLKAYELPVVSDDILGLLSGAQLRVATAQLSMATSNNSINVNIVNKQPDGEIRIKTITASITDDDWQDGTYFIAGKLDDGLPTGLHLLSSLVYEEKTIAECINQISANSPYFDIVFRNVPKGTSKLVNVKLLLVCP